MKRIAVLGIGAHTLPSSRALLNYLAQHYSITVYAEVVVSPDWYKLDHTYAIKPTVYKIWPRRIRDLLFLISLLKDYRREPFQLIHAHSTYPTGFIAVVLQKILGLPALVNLDGGEAVALSGIAFGDLHSKRRAKLNKWIINEAKAVTTLTRYQREQVYNNMAVSRAIQVLPRGVNQNIFGRVAKRGIGNPIVFLNVGYLSPVKDPEMLVRAFHLIQQQVNSVLVQVGEDFMKGEIQKLAEELEISEKIRFEGYVSYNKIPHYYAQSDVLLLTSKYESQGVVVAEAMASGVLVCGTHVGLIADLSGSCCVSSPVSDYVELAQAVLSLLKDEERMNQLRTNGYAWSSTHSLENCANEFRKIYEQLGV